MDEQNPRVGGKRPRDRADSGVTAVDQSRRATARTHEIRAEIEQTREDMSETVNEIQERLRPGAIASRTADTVKQAAMETARDVADSDSVQYVRANPIPAAMVGVGIAGLAWLATRGNNGRSSRRPYFGGDSSRTGRDWSSERYPAGRDFHAGEDDAYLQGGSRKFRGRSHSAAAEMGHYVPNQLRRTWHETPLLIGAASAILGAIVGLTVPETDRENELMGETRDSVLDTVQETVRDKVTQVQQAATDAAGIVQDAAKSAVGLASKDSTNDRT